MENLKSLDKRVKNKQEVTSWLMVFKGGQRWPRVAKIANLLPRPIPTPILIVNSKNQIIEQNQATKKTFQNLNLNTDNFTSKFFVNEKD
jgi:hypothetical protein